MFVMVWVVEGVDGFDVAKPGELPYVAYDIPTGTIKALAKNMKTIVSTVIFNRLTFFNYYLSLKKRITSLELLIILHLMILILSKSI